LDIRDARLSDFPAIEALVRGGWRPDHATGSDLYCATETVQDKLDALREEFEGIGSRFLVAYEGPKAVGVVLSRENLGRAWIETLVVAPGPGARGVAAELLSAVAPADADAFFEVNRRNEALLGLLGELGFAECGETVTLRRSARGEPAA